MNFLAMLIWAVAVWQQVAGVVAPPLEVRPERIDYAVAAAAPNDGHCVLFEGRAWRGFPTEAQEWFALHEIGHCLGVWEHREDGLMSGAVFPWFSAGDILAVQNANHVRPYRVFVVVAHE